MPYYNNFGSPYPSVTPANAYGYSQMPTPNQQPEPIFKYVSGRSGAEAYPLAPDTNAFLVQNATIDITRVR